MRKKQVFTEKGQLNTFISKSIERTIGNLTDNPTKNPEIAKKCGRNMKSINNPMYSKHHNINAKRLMHNKRWKPYSNHRTFYRTQARKIMEKKLNRKITPSEIVHHLDQNQRNNNIDNLYLFPSNRKHIRYHRKLRRIVRDELNLKKTNWVYK